MKLAVVANDELKAELVAVPPQSDAEFLWLNSIAELNKDADAVIHLLFTNNAEEINQLKNFLPKPVIVNSVLNTLSELGHPFTRLNGWPSFLQREIAEVACNNDENKIACEKIFAATGRKVEWVPDITGFISPRVLAMIINEAYFALEEKVSTKEEIDTAMKLGTNYPYGPFEWAEKIGLENILALLTKLALTENRYQPAPLLIKDATSK